MIIDIGTTESYTDGLVQERRNSNSLAMELLLSCTNPSISTQMGDESGIPRNRIRNTMTKEQRFINNTD